MTARIATMIAVPYSLIDASARYRAVGEAGRRPSE